MLRYRPHLYDPVSEIRPDQWFVARGAAANLEHQDAYAQRPEPPLVFTPLGGTEFYVDPLAPPPFGDMGSFLA
jgi:hypothetical protein